MKATTISTNAARRWALVHVLLLQGILFGTSHNCLAMIVSHTPPQKQRQPPPLQPIRSVAIVGGGIAGLTVAQCLQKYGIPYDIFDARPSFDRNAGAGMQLNGGLNILGRIDASLLDAVYQAGLVQASIRSTCIPWFGGSSSDRPYDTLLEIPLKETVQSMGGEITETLLDNRNNDHRRLLWVSIRRGALQHELSKGLKNRVQFQKKLTAIRNDYCEFADGSTTGPYDLIVGAEGINSKVQEYVAGNPSEKGKQGAIYTGLRIRYAVGDSADNEQASTLTQYFGNGVYALNGIYGNGPNQPNTKCGFLVYLDEDFIGPFPRAETKAASLGSNDDENVDWSQDNRKPDVLRKDMLQQLQDSGIQSAEVEASIQNADCFFELGSYFHNPFRKWSAQVEGTHLVLCGDAAHALPPFLGQGANQAIQDAYCLTEKIAIYNAQLEVQNESTKDKVSEDSNVVDLQQLFREYKERRWPATFNIVWKSIFLGYLETGGVDGFYAKFRDLFFRVMFLSGVAKRILLGAAAPRV